jgi:hypothetical protein
MSRWVSGTGDYSDGELLFLGSFLMAYMEDLTFFIGEPYGDMPPFDTHPKELLI